MRILVYGINFAPELTGIGKYSGEMATWLAERGHDVRVVTAPPYYPAWRVGDGYSGSCYMKEVINGVTVFRAPVYVPRQPKTLSRLLHLCSFALTSLPTLLLQMRWKPDVVVCVAPTLFCAPSAVIFSKLTGAKSVLHVQDFELDAMLGLGMAKAGSFTSQLALRLERLLFSSFDKVSTISHSMLQHARRKGVQEYDLLYFPNWVDASFITPHADRRVFRQLWGYADDDIVALYSGNLGKKQGLENVLEAASVLSDVQFAIVGDGAHGAVLMEHVQRASLKNVRFFPLQPYDALPNLLMMPDMHLVIQKRGAADVVLPSKLTSILAAGGHAVITADAETELGKLVADNPGIAKLIEPENVLALIEGIRSLADGKGDSEESHNLVARRYAEDNLSREAVLGQFEVDLAALCSGTEEGSMAPLF